MVWKKVHRVKPSIVGVYVEGVSFRLNTMSFGIHFCGHRPFCVRVGCGCRWWLRLTKSSLSGHTQNLINFEETTFLRFVRALLSLWIRRTLSQNISNVLGTSWSILRSKCLDFHHFMYFPEASKIHSIKRMQTAPTRAHSAKAIGIYNRNGKEKAKQFA